MMSDLTDFADMMQLTRSWFKRKSRSRDGQRTFDTAVSVRCHIVEENQIVYDANGAERTATGRIYCLGTVDGSGKLTIGPLAVNEADEFEIAPGRRVKILTVAQRWDKDEGHHTLVYFGV